MIQRLLVEPKRFDLTVMADGTLLIQHMYESGQILAWQEPLCCPEDCERERGNG